MKKLLILLTLNFCLGTAIANNSNDLTTTVKPIQVEVNVLQAINNDFLPTSHVTKQLTFEIASNSPRHDCRLACQAELFSCQDNGGGISCLNDYVDCDELCSIGGGSGF